MSNRPSRFPVMPQRQRGIVMIVMMTIIVLGSTMLLVSRLNNASWQRLDVTQTAHALAEAKQALIGFAARSPGRPGELPCPDDNNDGDADYDPANFNLCDSLTGRLPWRTLGLNDLRDGSGERLWYTVSSNLQANVTAAINSNTPAQLTVDTLPGVAAIVMAAHEVLAGQNRNAANRNIPAAYLEGDNATMGDDSFTSQAGQPFNDRLLMITQQELMTVVERRVVNDMRKRLRDYYVGNGFLPYAASLGGSPDYFCDNTVLSGRVHLALGPNPMVGCTDVPDWPAYLPVPDWFAPNGWTEVISYTLAAPCAPGAALCNGAVAAQLVSAVYNQIAIVEP